MSKKWFNTEIKKNIQLSGFVEGIIPSEAEGNILTKGFVTSFEARFYTYIEELSKVFNFNPDKSNNLLITIDINNTAKIYREKFPLSMGIRAKSDLKKFQLLKKKDVIDFLEITFSDAQSNIDPLANEKVVWLFRRGFSFGLYFDLSQTLRPEVAKKEMALLMQRVIFFDLYNHIEEEIIDTLITNGWFPFIQIVGGDHVNLFSFFEENKPELLEKWCDKTFTNERIVNITSKWFGHYAFSEKSKPITEGLSCFFEGKFAAAISSLIPMVEGISNLFMLRTTGKGIGYKGDDVTNQIEILSRKKYNEDSLFFVKHFKQYLKSYYYKHNSSAESDNAVRNTISHGRATNDSFTKENAVKIILTLDQLYYFI